MSVPYLDEPDPLQQQLVEELRAGRLRLATSDPKHRTPYFVNGKRRVHTVVEQVEPDPCPNHWKHRWNDGGPKDGDHHDPSCFRWTNRPPWVAG